MIAGGEGDIPHSQRRKDAEGKARPETLSHGGRTPDPFALADEVLKDVRGICGCIPLSRVSQQKVLRNHFAVAAVLPITTAVDESVPPHLRGEEYCRAFLPE